MIEVASLPRIIVVGAGYFGRHWMDVVDARSDCVLVGNVAADPETLAAAKAQWKGKTPVAAFASLDEALSQCCPDLAVVAVPEFAHREVVCSLLQNGIHCICEKPIALTWDDAVAIVRARPSGKVVAINQQFRWRPTIQTLLAQLHKGAIGKLGEIEIIHRQDIRRTTTGGWRETMRHPYLFDMAVHFFDLMRYLSGREAVSVSASAYRPAWSLFAGYPALTADVTMDDGVHARFSGTFVARGWQTIQEGAITLVGSDGTLRLDESGTVSLHSVGTVQDIALLQDADDDCGKTLTDVLEAMKRDSRPPTDLSDNMKTFAIVVAAEAACNSGQATRVKWEA
ncbi:MAG: Gfo/Idh/MocA family oxidoreductase [Burkholderiaceae bacterium]|nr:Gfo/Idh/MocA family oxidoreductase [Burkholderiaceae bacterium]